MCGQVNGGYVSALLKHTACVCSELRMGWVFGAAVASERADTDRIRGIGGAGGDGGALCGRSISAISRHI
jgi:hypothetical protein